MNIAQYSITKRTVTLFLSLLILIGGTAAYFQMGKLEDPEYTIKTAVVITRYPGATPSEVEEEVTDVIETAVQQLGQVDEVRSLSREGISTIYVDIKDTYTGKDLPQIWDELRRKVNGARSLLPPGVGEPFVNDDYGDVYGVYFALSGEGYSYKELKEYADFLKRELLLVKDVARVAIQGDQREVIYVEISRAKMATMGISPDAIYGVLNQQNTISQVAKTSVGDEYLRIDPTGGLRSVEDIGDLVIGGGPSGALVHLRDVATVTRSYMDPPYSLMRFNGKAALGIGISTVSGGNVVEMGQAVKEKLAMLEGQAPLGMVLERIYLQSDRVTIAINGFLINLAEALGIVIALLVVFMGWHSGLLIGGVLLLTIGATFLTMQFMGIFLQRISLASLIIALGMLVDNAIVITEGIMVKIHTGMDRFKAAGQTAKETMWPLLGATIIAILAFSAIGLSPDSVGEYCRSLFQVVGISLLWSWILALTLTPLLCHMLIPEKDGGPQEDPYGGKFFNLYRNFLKTRLNRRWQTMMVMAGFLFVAIWGFGFIDKTFFPDSDLPLLKVDFRNPESVSIEKTSKDMEKIEDYLIRQGEVESVSTFVGGGALRFMLSYSPPDASSNMGQILVRVKDFKDLGSIIERTRNYLTENFPDSLPMTDLMPLGPPGGGVEVRFRGYDPAILRELSNQAKAIMADDPYAIDVRDTWNERVKVLRPQILEKQARLVGLTRPDINRALQTAFSGYPIGIYREGNDLLPIVSRYPEKDRGGIEDLDKVQVWNANTNRVIPLGSVMSGLRTEYEDPVIWRKNRVRTITAQCDAKTGTTNVMLFNRLKPLLENIILPQGYTMEWGGEHENSSDAQAGLSKMLPISLLLMVTILVVLFNALRQPLIIILCLPLAIIGVAAGLLLTGQPFSFMALLGFLSLTGMLIKNAIVLIDQIDLEIRSGKERFDAVLDSAVSRLRPVMMASMTTVLGMIPLIWDILFAPMAATIMFGLTFGTVLTLIVVPVLYALFFRIDEPVKEEPEAV